MTSVSKSALVFVACTLALVAADTWNTKDYKDWTDQEANQILTKSPWTQAVKASMDASGTQRPSGGNGSGNAGGLGRGGGVGNSGGMGGPGGGTGRGRNGNTGMGNAGGGSGAGRPRAGATQMEVTVRWDSALPVRQALVKSQGGDAAKLADPQKNYIVSVDGLRIPRRASGDDQQDDNAARIRNTLMSTTKLVRKDKDPIAPADVKVDGNTVQFLFPRSDAIKLEDKEVTFITHVGRAKVEHKFKLKDMVYKGQLEL